jgi:hypothetical protein
MATLETQYKNYLKLNPDSTFTFEEWKEDFGGNVLRQMSDILKEIKTPEYKERRIKEHEERLKNITMDYQLGQYVGEYIVSHNLPTLSTDMIHSNRVIKVSDEEQTECERLDGEYVKSLEANQWKNGDSELFEAWKQYRKVLEKKYLPQVLECHLSLIRIDDIVKFKEGLSDCLWNCDMCSYDIKEENITIENDLLNGFTIIKFQYDSSCNDEMKK